MSKTVKRDRPPHMLSRCRAHRHLPDINPQKTVAVAMSGGVDSSVAAALLKKRFDVVGITMKIWNCALDGTPANKRACCSVRDLEDAKKVARTLSIPHYVLDLHNDFERDVITPFYNGYLNGLTPNPCITCNRKIKFGLLLDKVGSMGIDYLATGHYAKIIKTGSGFLLKKGVDENEQSYWLYNLTQRQMKKIVFPLGDMTKDKVRTMARRLELPVSEKPKSREICFIPQNDYRAFFINRAAEKNFSGFIYNRNDEIIGRHNGIFNFTVGQREGLGISTGRKMFVTDIIQEKKKVVVGEKRDLFRDECIAGEVNWNAGRRNIKFPLRVKARIRYKHEETGVMVFPFRKNFYKILFDKPQPAITPGQSIVFYGRDTVLGGGIIQRHGVINKE